MGVGPADGFHARKGGNQHEQGGAGQVEVGDEPIHGLEAIARVMKMSVSPLPARTVPSPKAAASRVRMEVVPTAMTRPPRARVSRMAWAVASGTL